MIDLCDNDDQLAVVLGHEMAHAVLGHVPEKLTLSSFVQVFIVRSPGSLLNKFHTMI